MAADQIFLAEPAPACCSGCFQAQPQMRHVDFSAAYDGPMVPALEGTVGVVAHSIDDLILCETCITQAAELLGLGNAVTLTAERDQLEASIAELHMRLRGLEDYNEKLQTALTSKPAVDRAGMREAPRKRQAAKR